MITCPACKNNEMPGALFCSRCGNQLIYPDNTTTSSIKTAFPSLSESEKPPPFPPPPADASDSKVALLLLNNEVAIHLRGKDDFTLGRSTKGQTIIPDIDLNPYDAYQAGVSRLHANIRISGSEIFIHDMGSVNGTYLNGKRLDANLEYPVHHGDVLTVGQLKIQVLMKEE